jgi:hypothetical protein
MALKITATLVDANKKPQAGVTVQAYFYRQTGSVFAVGKGQTKANGDLSINVTQSISDYLPRLELRMQVGRSWRVLSNTPTKYTSAEASFGTLEVATKPVMTMGTTNLYSVSPTFALPREVEKTTALNERLAVSDAQNVTLTKELATLKLNNTSLNKQLATQKQTNLSLTQQISTLNTNNEQLNRNLADTKSHWLNEQKARKAADKKVQTLEKNLATTQRQLEAANTALQQQKPQETEVKDLFDSAALHLEEAQNRIKGRKSAFFMSKVSMNLKVVPGRSGSTVKLPDKDEVKEIGADALSDIKIEFSDLAARQADATTLQQVVVPDLMGYTRNLAQRKLQNESLKPMIHEEYVGRGAVARQRNGRVLSQNPPAGTKVMPNSAIYVVIGRAAIEENTPE